MKCLHMQLLVFICVVVIISIVLVGSAVNTVKISQESDYYIKG